MAGELLLLPNPRYVSISPLDVHLAKMHYSSEPFDCPSFRRESRSTLDLDKTRVFTTIRVGGTGTDLTQDEKDLLLLALFHVQPKSPGGFLTRLLDKVKCCTNVAECDFDVLVKKTHEWLFINAANRELLHPIVDYCETNWHRDKSCIRFELLRAMDFNIQEMNNLQVLLCRMYASKSREKMLGAHFRIIQLKDPLDYYGCLDKEFPEKLRMAELDAESTRMAWSISMDRLEQWEAMCSIK
jgi:hypothetical protein